MPIRWRVFLVLFFLSATSLAQRPAAAPDPIQQALTLRTLGDLELSPATGDGLPRLPADTSLRDALSLAVAERWETFLVVGPDDSPLGVVKREDLLK